MPQDVSVTIKELLWKNWATTNPDNDSATETTFNPNFVYFTTRKWATNPQRIHKYQVSVLSEGLKETPEEIGAVAMYKVEESIEVHVWAVVGIGDDFPSVRQRARNMMDSVDIILRIGAVAGNTLALGIQFIRISPGWRTPLDDLDSRLVFHRVKDLTAIYYRTETQLPAGAPIILPTLPTLLADIGQADLASAG